MELNEFVRRSFTVKAVQITSENISEVAAWCGATVMVNRPKWGPREHIELTVSTLGGRPQKAPVFVGDWITETNGTFQRYRERKFWSNFTVKPDPKHDAKYAAVFLAIKNFYGDNEEAVNLTEQIMKLI